MKPAEPFNVTVRRLVKAALREDLGARGDVTSRAVIAPGSRSIARLVARENGIVCGIRIAVETFRQMDRGVAVRVLRPDGSTVRRGQTVLEIRARTRAILAAERTALNFVQRLSGVATLTRRFVESAARANLKTRILDTRKTTPLLRALEKAAVRCGGAVNHRFGLFDMVLIKDNHLVALEQRVVCPVREAVTRARRQCPRLKVEVECDRLDQVRAAVVAGADVILLDNMPPALLRRAVRIVNGRAKTEASGGVTLRNVAAIARTGVDFISVGALTHSAPALDFSLELHDA